MRPRSHAHITEIAAMPYRSTSCWIGTHSSCTESCPISAPIDVPVVYEACDCLCHSTVGRLKPAEVEQ